ncbi:carboxypeptidase regulatory-like domain-containing protein [candidate division CSSED10-310 bacterium]|uniref:Carboxypeptidase regulatory-like domain-containing protein n=1 Tax=candidate division CSSED10-310 bacterium TaxID=2855610 RepID=A0ABV6Z3L7_UNCC1
MRYQPKKSKLFQILLILVAHLLSTLFVTSCSDSEPDSNNGIYEVASSSNLLTNAGFEEGDQSPDGWSTSTSPGANVVFTWEDERAHEGSRSVSIVIGDGSTASWRQTVPVKAGRVYLLYGYVATEDVVLQGQCNLQLVFKDSEEKHIKTIDFPRHTGSRDFQLDFPTNLKVRTPAQATMVEVNLFLKGEGKAYFDDICLTSAPLGKIAGTVKCNGMPLSGARVKIDSDPWNQKYAVKTDSDGYYELTEVPVAFPRYILLASKNGFKTQAIGRIRIEQRKVTTVNFDLEQGLDPLDDLHVKFGTLEYAIFSTPPPLPTGATIPPDKTGYPNKVQAFLEPDETIESDHPDVIALKNKILARVSDPTVTAAVTWETYVWFCQAMEHDGVYNRDLGIRSPYMDVTCGLWQTLSASKGEDGWAFGKNFTDWTYKPHELMAVDGGICVEHALLCAALFRAMNIPARAFSGAMEFWAQTNMGDGAWFSMRTSKGRNIYRETGELGEGYATPGGLTIFPVTPGAMAHEDWDWSNQGLWREKHPGTQIYTGTDAGQAQAIADLQTFATTGEAPKSELPAEPETDRYKIHYYGITLNLFNIGAQRELDVSFPLVPDTANHTSQGIHKYWTNHPESVIETYIETVSNAPGVEHTERWYHIKFDLSGLLVDE